MLRSTLVGAADTGGRGFRVRSREVSRLEGLSDAVFGFAITLLVVSLEVPDTFDELVAMMRGFVAFAASFAVLIMIWYEHYTFFRRYGHDDGTARPPPRRRHRPTTVREDRTVVVLETRRSELPQRAARNGEHRFHRRAVVLLLCKSVKSVKSAKSVFAVLGNRCPPF